MVNEATMEILDIYEYIPTTGLRVDLREFVPAVACAFTGSVDALPFARTSGEGDPATK